MKKIIFKISLILFLLFLVFVTFHPLTPYIFSQAWHQISILIKSRPVKDVIQDDHFPDSLKVKLKLIEEIKHFAKSEFQYKGDDNKTVYDQKGKPVLWNISACDPFSFTEKIWDFPLIGSFPYKGFFNHNWAMEELNELKNNGLDTRIYEVEGWSTLGWFNDPILSNMLTESEGELANTILHELTHSNIFKEDCTEFNENIASFIAEKGTEEFLKAKYGINSEQVNTFLKNEIIRKKFVLHILSGFHRLDSLYSSSDFLQMDTSRKRILKKHIIEKIVSDFDTIPEVKKHYSISSKWFPNNAYFITYKYYHNQQNRFEKELSVNFMGDVKKYVNYLVNLVF